MCADANVNPDTQMPGDGDAHDDTEGRLEFPMLPECVTGANEVRFVQFVIWGV